MEAEYIATSGVMKSLFLLQCVHKEICTGFGLPFDQQSNILMTFEDNQAALLLATTDLPCVTP